MIGKDGRITTHGSPVRRKDRELYKTEVKPCRTRKLSKEELDNELRKIGVEVIKWGSSAEKKGSAERDFLSPSAKKTDLTEYAGACSIAEKLVMRQI